jgi:hypothetical protein
MTDKEALKLAIQLRDTASGYWTENEIPIIEKLIELLAQTQEPVAWQFFQDGKWHNGMEVNDHRKHTEAAGTPVRDLYTASPQRTEQEPVAHLWECLGRWSAYLVNNGTQAECAPPSWLVDAVKNATTPPQRTWVGLTLEQYIAINQSCVTVDQAICSTERQLKENNK